MLYVPPFRGFARTFIFICAGVFILELFSRAEAFGNGLLFDQMLRFFGLVPELVFQGMIYQLVTWVFFHGSLMHFLFNALAFWMFGSMLEEQFGTRRFVIFSFVAGILTGVIVCLFGLFDQQTYVGTTIGASGIVFAILIAVSRLFPHQTVLVFFFFPMKMKYFAYLMVAIEFYMLYTSNQSHISNIAHLGGALVGWFYVGRLRGGGGRFMGGGSFFRQLRDRWHQRRMKKRLRLIRVNEGPTYHLDWGL